MEIWKHIPGYSNYQVSNFGNVRSLNRVTKGRRRKGKLLNPNIDSTGYRTVNIYQDCIVKRFRVHQLVAMAFLGYTPNGHKKVIDHIDNNPLNNNVNNLQIISQRENSSKDKRGYSSKYVGVSWCKTTKKWYSCIKIKGKTKNLGYYNCELEAQKAYEKALINFKPA